MHDNRHRHLAVLAGLLIVLAGGPGASAGEAAQQRAKLPAVRRFQFHYGATVADVPAGARARIWIPVPTSDFEQEVERLSADAPGTLQETSEARFGNRLYYFEAVGDDRGEIRFDLAYRVVRRESNLATAERAKSQVHDLHLKPSRFVPVDGRILKQLMGNDPIAGEDGLAKARRIYEAVDARLQYDKPAGKPWGRGDALWACESRYGNCTDFHSIFIGACQDLGIPAKFEMGLALPELRGGGAVNGYHCWAKFLHEGRWIPVDISEADKHPEMKEYYFGNLTADRVKLTEGRDLELMPAPAAGPVNFLVHPYVEINGAPHANVSTRYRYQDE